jgi:recombination protein RecA
MAPPFHDAEFDIMYGDGISKVGDLIDVGVEAGLVEKSGSWYSYSGERIGQGRENVKRFMMDNSDIFGDLYQKVREAIGLSEKEVSEKEVSEKDGEAMPEEAE